ncbi:MAG: APC family permease [Gammaproteobacteria bacterium]|nr:APC family permease [Gammaproteobacteria bacterium]
MSNSASPPSRPADSPSPTAAPGLLDWTTLKTRFRRLVIGPPRDPMAPETRRHITLIAFLAWVGLGADGLSSSNYGPEVAFRALGDHTGLALFLAMATAITVFVIALSYNQVIELFPTGGGGYKVATRLLGRRFGLVSGAALVVDYVLTIAISIAAGADAMFSFLPAAWEPLKLWVAMFFLAVLVTLNLRGVKESINILLPIFIGFVLTHAFLIVYGIARHADRIDFLLPESMQAAQALSAETGWLFVVALFIRAYGIGGGTYTGIEAVSNSINLLKEPRVRTGKWTMFYMALSLAFTAAGIILLYLLWDARPVEGQTLNAVVFGAILYDWQWAGVDIGRLFLIATLLFATGLLFVAANTGFLGGPATLANMAVDHWVPHRYSELSDRLVTKNGIFLMGLAALAVLLWSGGAVELLVVLYSVSVFLTFSLTLLGLSVYWWRHRRERRGWLWRLGLTLWGLGITASILLVLLVTKFAAGGWIAIAVIAALVGLCLLVYGHYRKVRLQLMELDEILGNLPAPEKIQTPPIREGEPAAVFFVSSYRGIGIHTLLNAQRLFPGRFKNFVFLSVGEVDTTRIKEDQAIENLQHRVDEQLQKYVRFCRAHGLAATSYAAFGTDAVEAIVGLADEVLQRFPGSMFFAGTLVFKDENWFTRLLHNYTAIAIQRQLHLKGVPLIIMPMLVDARKPVPAT